CRCKQSSICPHLQSIDGILHPAAATLADRRDFHSKRVAQDADEIMRGVEIFAEEGQRLPAGEIVDGVGCWIILVRAVEENELASVGVNAPDGVEVGLADTIRAELQQREDAVALRAGAAQQQSALVVYPVHPT